ncbi:MAG: hypothetical protein ACE5IH_07330 [Thermodesulfobacteriota bacterium]
MKAFLWILLLIEVIVSSILVLTLLFIVIRKKDRLYSRNAFEKLPEIKDTFKALPYLFFSTLGFFLFHEIIEIVHHLHSSPPFYLTLFSDIRHISIYLFLVPLQAFCVYLALKLIRQKR